LYIGQSHSTTIHLDPLSRKPLALVVALVLSFVALVLAAGEAKAAQQPPTVVQQPSTEVQQFPAKTSTEYSAATDKKVAEPVPEVPSVVSNPLETLFPAPPLLKGSTLLQSLPNPTPEPPALQPPPPPAPADSLQKLQKPVSKLTGESTRPEDPEPPSAKPDSARQQNPAPPVPLGREVPDPVPDPLSSQPTLLPVSEPSPEPELKKPIALQAASETLPLQAEEPSVTKALEQAGMLASLPENVPANYSVSPIAPTSYRADQSIAASRAIIPVPLEGGLHSTTNLGHIKPSVSTSFAGSPEPSSNDTQKPLEDTPQPPEPPLAPPVGDAPLFSLGGAQTAPGGALALLLICIFASGMVLLRPNSKLHLASCTIPKPSSALLMPLERPG
jgi:hypothetical protein